MSGLGRVPIVLAGYLAAVAVASIVVISPFWLTNTLGFWIVPFLAVALALTALLSLVPAVLIVDHAERVGIRGVGFYMLWGLAAGGIGFIVVLLFFVANGARFAGGNQLLWWSAVVIAVAGCAGGATYWAVAGRNAGTPRKAPEA